MTELLFARGRMAMLFAFQIVFSVAGMGMPILMVVAETAGRKTGKPVYLELARRWSRGMGVSPIPKHHPGRLRAPSHSDEALVPIRSG